MAEPTAAAVESSSSPSSPGASFTIERPSSTPAPAVPFKQQYDLERRKALSLKMKTSYPDRIPVIVEKHPRSRTVPDINKTKFLAPGELTIAQFMLEIRQHMPLDSSSALYLFFGENIPNPSVLMIAAYENYKDEDGFLYVTYAGEKTFGTM